MRRRNGAPDSAIGSALRLPLLSPIQMLPVTLLRMLPSMGITLPEDRDQSQSIHGSPR